MQACISRLCSLTCLEVAGIKTPLKMPTLDDVFVGLPALQSVCLSFRTMDVADPTDLDSDFEEDLQLERHRRDDFPQSLLRCLRPEVACSATALQEHQ